MYVHIDLAILWIHDTGKQFSENIKHFLFSHHPKTKVYQLWGSSSRNPLELSQTALHTSYPERYREIFLGYERTGSSTRWLTDQEISEGIVQAVETDESQSTIGITDPWSKKY